MRKTINTIIFLLAVTTFVSCEDWFDISAKSELKGDDMLSNKEGYRDALVGCYATMAEYSLYGGQLTMTYLDVLAQYYSTANTATNNFYYAYQYDYENSTEETRKDNIWKNLYNVVANTNNLLDNIDESKDVFAAGEYNLIKGEALAIRAFIHLDLLRLFAPSPAMGGGQEKAIPYVDKFTNQLFEQLTVDGVLQRIIADLELSRSLLKEVDPYGPNSSSYDLNLLTGVWKGREYRFNYYSVTALLARAHLWRGQTDDMTKAYAYAKEVIDSDLFPLITSADVTSVDDNGFVQENITALECKELKDDVADQYFYVTNTNYNFLAANSTTLKYVFPSTLDMDYRLKWWIETTGSYNILSKYNSSKRLPLVKVSEMYLIAAETAPDISIATNYFNTLQFHRGLPDAEVTAETLPTLILQEYAKEFIGEGQTFYAYKRMACQMTPVRNVAIADPASVYVLPLPKENSYFK
ncbi:MAG: RagB/SusD family nutrient uptake outer membrane protein [Prevotella sp.]